MIDLYGMFGPNVRKVGIMLEELGADYTLHHAASFHGEQFTPEFLAQNPPGKIPVLIDHDKGGGVPVYESGAILIYLAETYNALLPPPGQARYEVLEWLMVQMAAIGAMFGEHNHFQLLGAQSNAQAAARYRSQTETLYRQLEERLAARGWFAGNAYSIADIAIYPCASYLEQHGFAPAAYPRLMRWRETVGARPAVGRMMQRFAAACSEPASHNAPPGRVFRRPPAGLSTARA